MSRPAAGPPVPVAVELGPALQWALAGPGASALRRRLEHDLRGLCRQVALAGSPLVELVPGAPPRALRVRVHGRLQPYPPDLMRRVWIAAAPRSLHHLAAAGRGEDGGSPYAYAWLAQLGEGRASGVSHRDVVVSWLARMVVEAVRRRPGCLLGPAQAAAYAGGTARPPWLGDALRSMLDLGLSLADEQTILGVASEGAGPIEAAELAYARLRSRWLELQVTPRYFAALTGRELRGPTAAVDGGLEPGLAEPFRRVEDELWSDLGVWVPAPTWVPAADLEDGALRTRVNGHLGLPEVPGLAPDELLVEETASSLSTRGIAARPVLVPATGGELAAVPAAAADAVRRAGLSSWTPVGFVALNALSAASRHADCFLDVLDVVNRLAGLEEESPHLVHALLARTTAGTLTKLLRSLITEGVSIRNLRPIVERVVDYDTVPVVAGGAASVLDDRLPVEDVGVLGMGEEWQRLREFVRLGLRHELRDRHLREPESVFVCLPGEEVEALARAMPDDAARERIRDVVWVQLEEATRLELRPAVVVSQGARAAVREVLAPELPRLPVLSETEAGPSAGPGRVELVDAK